jgi:hypothetical protein
MSFASEGNQTAPMINNINIQIIKKGKTLKLLNSDTKEPSI